MHYKVAINNQICDVERAMISIADRGFRFGDGIFDTMLFHNGRIFNLDFHLTRIQRGIEQLQLNVLAEIDETLHQFCKDIRYSGIIRIAITRGEGSIGYLPTSEKANIICEFNSRDLPSNDQAVRLMVSQYRKIPSECLPTGIKTMQGLNSTLAIMEAKQSGFDEAIQLSVGNLVCECSSANIFVKIGDYIYTPPLNDGVLQGSIRHVILHNLKMAEEKSLQINDLLRADEVFITSVGRIIKSVSEIKGVASYANKTSADLILKLIHELINE